MVAGVVPVCGISAQRRVMVSHHKEVKSLVLGAFNNRSDGAVSIAVG